MDERRAHKHFAPSCFNRTWELLEDFDSDRDAERQDELVLTAAASLWHWTQRDDVTAKNRSVGAWLLSRVYSVVDRRQEALYWAQRSLDLAEKAEAEPFYVGYAYEAFARAHQGSDPDEAKRYLELAEEQARSVDDEETRRLLEKDLAQFN